MNYSNNLKPNIIKTINEINSNIPSIQLSKNSIILLKNILFNLEIATKNWIELCKKSLKITKKQYINPNNHIPEFVKQEFESSKMHEKMVSSIFFPTTDDEILEYV